MSARIVPVQAERTVALVRHVLGDAVVAAYLHGSAVLGGLKPTSDIDVLVVSERPSTRDEMRALVAGLLRASGPGDPTGRSRSVELTVVVRSDVRPWRYPPRLDFQYGDWWRRTFESGDLTPWESPSPDLALTLAMVAQSSRTLFGPPPPDVLDPVPPADVRRAMHESIPVLLSDLDGDERNVVLTFARIWMTMSTAAFAPKDAAADWALARLPPEHRAVLARARAIYLGEAPEEWGELEPRIRPHVEHVRAEIERLAPSEPGVADAAHGVRT